MAFAQKSFMGRCIAAGVLAFAALGAQAQGYPERPIKMIIPYPPGGVSDGFGRALSAALAERLGQPVVPENRPGASLIAGTEAAAKAPADGYTLLLGSVSSLALNVGAFKALPYDPVKDFAPISLAFYTPLYLEINPDIPVKSVRELIAYAKAKPGALSFASIGHGSSLHLAGEMFKNMAGIDILHVPYKGVNTALPDLLSGRVSMIFDGGAFFTHVQAGKLRLLAVTSPKRLEFLSDTPTMAEAGVPGYEMVLWWGVVAPAGTPKPIVDRLAREVAELTRQPAFKERLKAYGNIELVSNTPEAFARLIRSDIALWSKLLKDAGVEPQ
jgi:tripartite-type tricarboxylate transporter receptor subunit TctC